MSDPNLLVLSEVIKSLVQYTLSVTLFKQWYNAKNRYLTDIQLHFSIVMFTIASGEVFDVIMDSRILEKSLLLYKLRGFILASGFTILMFLTSYIWLYGKKTLQAFVTCSYFYLFNYSIWYSETIGEVLRSIAIMIGILALPVLISFILVWKMKLIPSVSKPLLILGTGILIISQFLESFVLGSSGVWVSEVIDAFGWPLVFLSIKKVTFH
ncbi:MAG: hypothetical protein ACTSR0_02940 [Candidatus Asgardarchaeia archaeon]